MSRAVRLAVFGLSFALFACHSGADRCDAPNGPEYSCDPMPLGASDGCLDYVNPDSGRVYPNGCGVTTFECADHSVGGALTCICRRYAVVDGGVAAPWQCIY